MFRSSQPLRLSMLGLFLPLLICELWVGTPAGRGQDSSEESNLNRGVRPELAITVRDSSGEPMTGPGMVKIYKSGNPVDQGAVRKGRAFFILSSLGEYTVAVDAPGYQATQKDVSVSVAIRMEVDITMRPVATAGETFGVPGRPVLAPKAKEAFDKGLQALSADNLKEAEKHVNEAMRLAPGHPDVLYLRGVLDLKKHNFPDAQVVLQKATQIDPANPRAFAALGMAYSDQGKYEEAIPALEKSVELDSGKAGWDTDWLLAQAYYHRGKYAEALKTSQQAQAKSNGKAPEIDLLVAQSLTATGQYDAAAQALRDFLKQHGDRPDAAKARRWLDRLVADGKVAKP
jgi:Flp pilus assembly protein TadD